MTQSDVAAVQDLATLRDLFRSTLVRAECTPLSTVTALFSNLDDVIRTNEELFDRLAKRPVDGVVEVLSLSQHPCPFVSRAKGM